MPWDRNGVPVSMPHQNFMGARPEESKAHSIGVFCQASGLADMTPALKQQYI